MADINIPQNIFLIIIAVIVVVTIIIIVMQWRRVREAQSNVEFLQKQAELKKIELVDKDLGAKRMMENALPLPQEQQEKLGQIRGETSKLMHKTGFLHGEINERVTRLEALNEYEKLQKLLIEIEKREKDVEKKRKRKGGL